MSEPLLLLAPVGYFSLFMVQETKYRHRNVEKPESSSIVRKSFAQRLSLTASLNKENQFFETI